MKSSASVAYGSWPGLAPAGELLSFASPKESSQRKGEPAVCVPKQSFGQPAVLAAGGGPLELATLKQSRALIHLHLRSSAQPEGQWEPTTAPSPQLVALRATLLGACDWSHPKIICSSRLSHLARAKQSAAALAAVEAGLSSAADCGKRAGDCLSEASSSQPPQTASSARNRAAALPSARLSFANFSLAKQRKVSRPPGRDPACRRPTASNAFLPTPQRKTP
jgi:hypothetical protein